MRLEYLLTSGMFAIAIFPFVASAQQQQEPKAGFSFDAGKATQWIQLAGAEEDGIIIPVTVNGHATFADIDTGSTLPGVALISSKLLADEEKTGDHVVTARAYGGTAHFARGQVGSFVLGGIVLTNQPVTVTDMRLQRDSRVGVSIGLNLLSGVTLQVDWEHHRARFILGGDLPKTTSVISLALDERSRLLTLDATICDVAVKAVLDSGTDSDMHIVPERPELQRCAGKERSDIRGTGDGGATIKGLAAIPALSVGTRPFGPVIANIDTESGPLTRDNISTSIGLGVLRRSNFVLDIGNRAMLFYGPDRAPKVIYRPRVGIQYREDGNGLLITHLMLNSPAAASGLKAGDRICSLNGRTIASLDGVYDSISPPAGTSVRVGVCGGPTITIVAQDFMALPGVRDKAFPEGTLPIVEPTGVGDVTEAFARCQGEPGAETAKACSVVLNAPGVANFWKDVARMKRAAALPGVVTPGSH
ncbi:aspartyl protease family protein [Sphingomonas sp. TDK1]|uniref:aspartyl protease family protein n=1 Tax=Sphingomonas sp. TDK1 TaxID=453247 RepID=UPI0007D9ACEB|nr:PDZ domain-containing protein [Sphingomonas sp. TDK1]OAN62345.1 hypothetical protein A7X12_22985 [Sphingomonas sp. TDK1]